MDDFVEQVLAYIAEELPSAGDKMKSSVDQIEATSAELQISRGKRDRGIAAEVRASFAPEDIETLHRFFDPWSDLTQQR